MDKARKPILVTDENFHRSIDAIRAELAAEAKSDDRQRKDPYPRDTDDASEPPAADGKG